MSAALDFNAVDHKPLEPIANIKARTDIVDVIGRYADLKKRGGDHWAKCPLHTDGTPSFKVSPGRQQFYCFGCGAKGDVIDFLEAAEGLGKGQAIQRLRELTGGAAADPAAAAARAARRAAAAAQEALDAARKTAQARQIWSEAEYLTQRSDPLAVRYLTERRGITQWQAGGIRWHPHCPWGLGRTGCIIAPVENADREMTAIWRIKPVLEGKVERKGLGPIKGNFAPVTDDAGLSILTIAEGVEDALAARALTTYPAVAALSAGNMEDLELPQQFEQILICCDFDEVGIKAARTLARRLRAEGREVRVLRSQVGKDPNDALIARAA